MRTEAEDVPRKMTGVMKNSRFKIKNGYDIALTTRSFPCRRKSNSIQGNDTDIRQTTRVKTHACVLENIIARIKRKKLITEKRK